MSNELSLTLWQFFIVLATTFAGGVGLTFGTVGFIARNIRSDPALMKSLEAAAKNVDPDTALKLVQLGRSTAEVGALVEEVFDGESFDPERLVEKLS